MRPTEYVTIQNEKRNLGLKGLELMDVILLFIGLFIFLIIALAMGQLMAAIYFIIIYLCFLLPINVSNKNRMYKIIFLLFVYMSNKHIFIYFKNEKEGVLNETYEKIKEFKNKIRTKIIK